MGTAKGDILFFTVEVKLALKNRKLLKEFLKMIFRKENVRLAELRFIFCSDPFLLKINQEYLNHDTFTDIITFDLTNPGSSSVGEIYISVDRVKENATFYKQPFIQELHRVIFHGVLHLCGYPDKLISEKKTMRVKEDFYLKKYKTCVSRGTRST